MVCQLLLGRTSTEHAGVSGVQLSFDAEMEDYGDKQQLKITDLKKYILLLLLFFFFNIGRSQAGNIVITNIEWYNWQGQAEFC